MDAIVNDLANDVARLANIGDPGFDVNQKRSDLQQVLRIDIGGRNVDPFALFQQDWQDIDVFNNEFINIGREITHFYQSQHGIINVGTRYKTYTDIRNEFQALYHQVFRSQTLTQEQKDILLFILLPGYYLPQYSPGYNPDKASGEKTLSKMLLNAGVMNAKCRYENIEGFWRYYQLVHYA